MHSTGSILVRFIDKEWNHVAKLYVFINDDSYFVIILLVSVVDRNVILFAKPRTFNYRPLIVNPWDANFNFNEEILRVIPLWVKLPNLPLNC